MLEFIRERAQGWIAWTIVALLIVVFAAWGLDSYFRPDPEVPVAYVNDEKITSREFQQRYSNERARLQNMFSGIDIDTLIPDETEYKKQLVQVMIDNRVVLQNAADRGMLISDAHLAQIIRSEPSFQTDGQFDPSKYEQFIGQRFISSDYFESELRRGYLSEQFQRAVIDTTWVAESEKAALTSLQHQKRDIGYGVIRVNQYLDEIVVADDEIRAHYDSNSGQFVTQEQVSLEYIELALSKLEADVLVDEDALKSVYEERKDEFTVQEERRTSHILIEVDHESGDDAEAQARDRIDALLVRINNGEAFEDVAKDASDDFGSAREGGDLGFLIHDSMLDNVYADAAFALAEGEVSGIVRSTYGFHIIKLTGVRTGSVKTFDEVRAQLEHEYRAREAEDAFYDMSEQLANLSFENPDSLVPAAEALGIKVSTTPLFGREFAPGFAADPKIREVAFSDNVLLVGANSDVIELGEGRVAVIRVKEHKPSETRSFDEVKDLVAEQLKREKAVAQAKSDGTAMLAAIKEGGEIAALAKTHNVSWERPGASKRDSTALMREVTEHGFRMARPESETKPSVDGFSLPSGDYAVIAVFSVEDGVLAEQDEAQQQTLVQQRQRYYGGAELEGIIKRLRDKAEIRELPENI